MSFDQPRVLGIRTSLLLLDGLNPLPLNNNALPTRSTHGIFALVCNLPPLLLCFACLVLHRF